MTTSVAITGTRTLCQHPGCGVPIRQVIENNEWVHTDSFRPDHWANPVEPVQPVLERQALTHPSSLVDALLEAAKHHGIPTVTSPETYRAAEQAAGLLLHILRGEQ